jgi:hypothetical protein
LQAASEELAQTGSQMAQANAIREASAQTSESASRLLEAGRNAQSAQAGAANQFDQGTGPGQSQAGGQGSSGQGAGNQGGSQGSGGQESGSGSGKGSSDQGGSPGAEAGSEPIDQGNGPGDGGERPFAPMAGTQRLGDSEGAEVYLPKSQAPGDEVTGQANTSPGDAGASKVPYLEVYPEYAEVFRQAIESGEIPASMRDLVRKYFSNLEP